MKPLSNVRFHSSNSYLNSSPGSLSSPLQPTSPQPESELQDPIHSQMRAFRSSSVPPEASAFVSQSSAPALPASPSSNAPRFNELIWRNYGSSDANVNGRVSFWTMNGVNPTGTVQIPLLVPNPNWEIVGSGDFNKDGQADLIWRNYGSSTAEAGLVNIWIMNGDSPIGTIAMPLRVDNPNWRIEGVGDFNNDGNPDLVWRNYATTGAEAGLVNIWTMDGVNPMGTIQIPLRVDNPNWRIDAIGDFNGDGNPDLVWRNYGTSGAEAGLVNIWTLNGVNPMGTISMPLRVDNPNWRIEGAGDFNNDGSPDLVWRNYGTTGAEAGLVNIWTMNGVTPTGTIAMSVRVTDPNWRIDGVRTTTGDRIAGLQDVSIRQSINTALNDNLFTHQELTSLLRNTATAGVTSAEFSDLRLIANNLAPYLSATSRSYTQYIFNAVVNGNTANQWWTGGNSTRAALGNLSAGSSELQLNHLVDKWFGGNDLPTNFVGGDSAAGADSLTFTYGQMTGNLFVNGISYADVNQGQAGTCYLLAAASTLANNQSQFIQNMFLDNGDGTYGVRFYGESGNEIWVTVNQSVPVINGRLALAGNSTRSLTGEIWVALVEKAYAQANEIGQFGRDTTANSFSAIEGGWGDALTHISNQPITTYSAYYGNSGWTSANNNSTTWNSYLNAVIAAVNAGRSLWLGSFGDTYDSSGKQNFVSSHAFAITDYNPSTQRFTIANPWGAGGSSYTGVFESTWSNLFDIRAVVSWA